MSRFEKNKIDRNLANIRAENRSSIANTIAARVLLVLAESPNLKEGISGREIADVLRPITDNEINWEDATARKLDFRDLDDLISEVEPLIRRGLAKLRENKKAAA